MKIKDKLLEPYFIDADQFSFNVIKKGVTQKGDDKENVVGYFSNAESALKKIIKLKINESDDVYDLKQYVNKLKEQYEFINNLLK